MFSPPKKLALPGRVEVGEGSTSVNREGGSLRSAFQIPVPQGKEGGAWCPRPIAPDDEECDPQAAAPVSAEGVLGCEPVGDIELLANEPFLG